MRKIILDYSLIKTEQCLRFWFIEEMKLTKDELLLDERFIVAVFKALAQRGKETGVFEVVQLQEEKATNEVSALMKGQDGWRQALSFHLFREGTGAGVSFSNKKKWWQVY